MSDKVFDEELLGLAQAMSDLCANKSIGLVGDASSMIVQSAILQLHGDKALKYFQTMMAEFGFHNVVMVNEHSTNNC